MINLEVFVKYFDFETKIAIIEDENILFSGEIKNIPWTLMNKTIRRNIIVENDGTMIVEVDW